MKIKFCGANKNVTGSKHLLTINGKNILLECGMFQGRRAKEYQYNLILPFDAKKVDVALLSHAHIDHSGNLPNLVLQGFAGPVHCTFATRDLCYHMLRDSAFVQEREAEYINRKLLDKGSREIEAIYTMEDAEKSLEHLRGINYNQPFKVTDDVEATYYDAGHILGSAIIHLKFLDHDDNKEKTLVFTGDLGQKGLAILRDPYQVPTADYLITESTYGNRDHEDLNVAENKLKEMINKTVAHGGKIIIPAFSLGRTQEIVYILHQLLLAKQIPEIPIYVDSPLSVNVTEVFKEHPECFDEETKKEFINNQINPFGFNRLKYLSSADDSKSVMNKRGPYIMISASGMCEHGRILHHLKNAVEDSKNTIFIVGFMAEHTLGRKIWEKRPFIKIFGQNHALKAHVEVINAFSAHADKTGLIDFASNIKGLKKVFIVHGEEEQSEALEGFLRIKGLQDITIPTFGDEVTI